MSSLWNPGNQDLPFRPPILGRVEFPMPQDDLPGFWDKAWNVIKEALPPLGHAASLYNVMNNSTAHHYQPADMNQQDGIWDMLIQGSHRDRSVLRPKPIQPRSIPSYKSEPIARNALGKIVQPQAQAASNLQVMHQRTSRLLDEIALAKGLPSYEQFHHDNGVFYGVPPSRSNRRPERSKAPASSQANGNIRENITPNSNPQQPVGYSALGHAQLQKRPQNLHAYQEQRQARAQGLEPAMAFAGNKLIARANKNKTESIEDQVFRDPVKPGATIQEQASGLKRLPESKLRQVQLNLDRLKAQGKINENEYQQYATVAKAEVAQNWLTHDGKMNEKDQTVTYRGITVEKSLAPALAYVDADRYWASETHITPGFDWLGQLKPNSDHAGWASVLSNWFLEQGPIIQVYDGTNPITRDLQNDQGVQKIRELWNSSGKPPHFNQNYHFSVPEYARELLTLDGTGSLLGSYNVTIDRLPDKTLRFVVANQTGWQSGTRLPFTSYSTPSAEDILTGHSPYAFQMPTSKEPLKFLPQSILNDRHRGLPGPGGNMSQYYIWYEEE